MRSIVEVVQNLIKPYIDSVKQALTNVESDIAPIEDGTNYSTSYTKGAQFIRGGLLYKVTASSVNSSTAINTGTGGNAERANNVTTQITKMVSVWTQNTSITGDGTHSYADKTIDASRTGYTAIMVSCMGTNSINYRVVNSLLDTANQRIDIRMCRVDETNFPTTDTIIALLEVLYVKNDLA